MKQLYEQHTVIDPKFLSQKIKEFLNEDRADKDITTTHLSNNDKTKSAHIIAEEKMVFAGEQILQNIFKNNKHEIKVKDSMKCNAGDVIAVVSATSGFLLTRERVMLNLLQRLSGIATLTNQYVEKLNNNKIKILDTRKTTPGLRIFEKYAVNIGGGFNHRLDLNDGSMFKDNHLVLEENFITSIKTFKKAQPKKKLQIEVDTYEQLDFICSELSFNIDAILLDNMNPKQAQKCCTLIRNIQPNCFIELSGGINLDNILNYKAVDVDGISIGALTHQARSKNIKFEIQP